MGIFDSIRCGMRLLASRCLLQRIAARDTRITGWKEGMNRARSTVSSVHHIPFSGRPDPMNDLKQQTILHKDEGRRIESLGDKPLSTCLYEDTTTLYQMLRRGARVSRHGECLGHRVTHDDETRPYQYISYQEMISRSERLGAAILSFGIPPGQGTRIGIFSANRPEWLLMEHACYTYNMINVPVYATHGADECLYVLRQASIPLIFCDTADKAQSLITNAHRVPDIRVIVVGAPFDARLREDGQNLDIQVLSFSEFELRGHDMHQRPPPIPPRSDDIATICYTSGTTGAPKGVQVSHGNVAAVHSLLAYTNVKYDDTIRYLSYLPLAHMYERVVLAGALCVGGRIGFFSGNTQLLLDDCQEFRPNFLITVPRVLNKVYNMAYEQVRFSPVKLLLFNLALTYKKILVSRGTIRRDTWADRMIFKKIQALFGGDLDLVVCGSAPINSEVLTFFRAALGCILREGYGQTESTACGTITLEGDHSTGHVGVPMPSVEIKLLPITSPEKRINASCGEICLRGPIVAKGYFKAPKMTNETFLSDGWLRTGDIGRFDERGRLVLVDRIKNLVKLPNGEFLVPDKVESVYQQSPFVEQIYVHGQGDRNELVAIIVPNKEYLTQYAASELKLVGTNFAELCAKRDVRHAVAKQLRKLGLEMGLVSFEQLARFYFTEEPFTVENELLTPTLKNKRSNIAKKYANDIDWMYAKLDTKELQKKHI